MMMYSINFDIEATFLDLLSQILSGSLTGVGNQKDILAHLFKLVESINGFRDKTLSIELEES